MGGIKVINNTLTPIHIVLLQQIGGTPIDWKRHMNIAPGASCNLAVGEFKLKQFRVFVWGGGSPGTEMSEQRLNGLMAARWAASVGIAHVTAGAHELFSTLAESAIAELAQEAILDHLMIEVITPQVFEKAIEKGVGIVLDQAVERAMRPKEWGVCSEHFWAALDDNVRYVCGGPVIRDGKIVEGGNLRLSKWNDGRDPVRELKSLKRKTDVEKANNVAGTAVVVGGALLFGASLPFSAVAGTAYYLWNKK
jgi:hypothetical protein